MVDEDALNELIRGSIDAGDSLDSYSTSYNPTAEKEAKELVSNLNMNKFTKKYPTWTIQISGPGSTLHHVGHRIEKLLADEGAVVQVTNDHAVPSDIELCELKDTLIAVKYNHLPWGG